jgi:hypothetical protein
MIDRHGMTWLVDFDQAVAGADRRRTAADDQALNATLADLAGPAAAKARRARLAPTPGRRQRASHDRRTDHEIHAAAKRPPRAL